MLFDGIVLAVRRIVRQYSSAQNSLAVSVCQCRPAMSFGRTEYRLAISFAESLDNRLKISFGSTEYRSKMSFGSIV